MTKINFQTGGSTMVLSKDQMKKVLGGVDSPKKYKCCVTDGGQTSCSACVAVDHPYCEIGGVVTC